MLIFFPFIVSRHSKILVCPKVNVDKDTHRHTHTNANIHTDDMMDDMMASEGGGTIYVPEVLPKTIFLAITITLNQIVAKWMIWVLKISGLETAIDLIPKDLKIVSNSQVTLKIGISLICYD